MTRAVLAGLALTAVFGAGAWGGWAISQGRCAAAAAASQRALIRAGELASQKELQRLTAEAEREKIARELEIWRMQSPLRLLIVSLLAGCGGSISSEPSSPPSRVIPCADPVTLPERALSDQEIERYWGRDRAELRACGSKVSG